MVPITTKKSFRQVNFIAVQNWYFWTKPWQFHENELPASLCQVIMRAVNRSLHKTAVGNSADERADKRNIKTWDIIRDGYHNYGSIIMKIVTEQLMIRNLCETDYPEFERTLNDAQKSCFGSGKGFLNWLISQYSAMDISDGLLSFGIFEQQTKKFIGTIGIGDHDDLHEPEIFYHLLPEHRGYGFATEAAKEITRWALESYDIEYIIGTVAIDNVKSQHVLERCGYEFIEVRSLLVHVTNKRYDFKYYRHYKM